MSGPPFGDRAAYSASQPLFDALRAAVTRVERSQDLLQSAMTKVRREHVRANSNRVFSGEAEQESYIDETVSAWRDITDAFVPVFSELSALSEPRLDEGREGRTNHSIIKTLHQTAIAAKFAAFALPVRGDESIKPNSTKPAPKLNTTTEQAGKRPFITDLNEEPPFKVHRGEGQSDWKPVKSRKRPLSVEGAEEQSSKVRCVETAIPEPTQADATRSKANRGPARVSDDMASLHIDRTPTNPADKPYTVEYEDVTLEVDARLAAKASKAHAHNVPSFLEDRSKKKRKRQSLRSDGEDDMRDRLHAGLQTEHARRKVQKRQHG